MTLDLDTPEGDLRIEGKLNITASSADRPVRFAASVWSEQKQMAFSVDSKGTIAADGSYDTRIDLLDGRAEFSSFLISRLSGWGDVKGNVHSADLPSVAGQINAGKIVASSVVLQDVGVVLDTSRPEPLFFKTSPAGFPDISIAARWNKTVSPEQIEITAQSAKADRLYRLFPDSLIRRF